MEAGSRANITRMPEVMAKWTSEIILNQKEDETVIEIIGEIREATEEEKEAYERQLETEIDWREVLLSKFLKNH